MKRRETGVRPVRLPEGARRVLAALSGGADSVYLLRALLLGGAEVTAAHFHHGLRGASADGDLEFCRALCAEWGVKLIEGRGDVREFAEANRIGVETAAREMRHRFLREARERAGADVIALGHHMDDQAETVLMHLFRGAGTRGVSGMAERDGVLYRPLLHLTKREIAERLREDGLSWREDETNRVDDNPRNALRNRVLPEIERLYPGAAAALSRFSEIARADEEYLSKEAERAWAERAERLPNGWRLNGAASLPAPLLSRALMEKTGIRDQRRLAEIAEAVKKTRKAAQFNGIRLEPSGETLYIIDVSIRFTGESAFRTIGETELNGLCRMISEPFEGEPIRGNGAVQVLDREALEGAVLRTRREGDRIQPLGSRGSRLLSDYLTDRKTPRPERDAIPLLAKGGDVLWAVGIGISERAKVRPGRETVRVRCETRFRDYE